MKSFKYALLAVTLLISGGLLAETKAQAAKRKATAAKVREYERKHKAKKAKTERVGYAKKPAKPVTKRVTTPQAVRTAPVRNTTATSAAKPQDKSYVTQLTDALGWTGGTTAVAAAATTAVAHGQVKHEGPESFALDGHRIPYHWKNGWTGGYYNGEWQFAGHNLKWWHANYPSYYKNVVRPEATKAGITERQHFAHEETSAGHKRKLVDEVKDLFKKQK